eukprot:2260483-Amphidinium_carterae.1
MDDSTNDSLSSPSRSLLTESLRFSWAATSDIYLSLSGNAPLFFGLCLCARVLHSKHLKTAKIHE